MSSLDQPTPGAANPIQGASIPPNTINLVQQNFNASLAIEGVLLTMFDARLNLSRQVAAEATEYFEGQVYSTVIPRNVRIAEAPSFGKPILLYDVQSVGAKSYLTLAQEILRRVQSLASGVPDMQSPTRVPA